MILSGISVRAEGLQGMDRFCVRMCRRRYSGAKRVFTVVVAWNSHPQGGTENFAQTAAGGNGGKHTRRK